MDEQGESESIAACPTLVNTRKPPHRMGGAGTRTWLLHRVVMPARVHAKQTQHFIGYRPPQVGQFISRDRGGAGATKQPYTVSRGDAGYVGDVDGRGLHAHATKNRHTPPASYSNTTP